MSSINEKLLNEKLRLALEQIDANSWEELCRAVPAEVARTLQMSIERQEGVVISHCLVADAPLSNRAIGLGLGSRCTRDQIRTLSEKFVATGMKNFALQISPYARPAELEQWLADAGLVLRGYTVKLLRDHAPPVPDDTHCEVRLVGKRDAAVFGDVSARGFGRPPIIAHWMAATVGFPRWRHYLAYVDGQPAGTAAMYLDGDVAWMGIGSTLPEYRRQGTQQALIARRIGDGLDLGIKHFVAETESFNTSCQNLMRAGFACAYERANYGIAVHGQE